jgi:TolB-like protein
MTFLRSFSGNRCFLAICLASLIVSGCAVTRVVPPGEREGLRPLKVASLSPDKASPQAAGVSTVRRKPDASGGVGDIEYTFRAGLNSLIAVMPLENLTGLPVPSDQARRSLVQGMKGKGLNVLAEDVQEKFLERHRVRYAGGINRDLGKALREETGTSAVLFAALEAFDESNPPKVALSARLVSTQGDADILWADSIGISGNDHPGFLLLGMVDDAGVLWEKAKGRILDSLSRHLSGGLPFDARRVEKKFVPKSYHGVSPKIPAGKDTISVAVLPFENDSTRRNAGELLSLHFTRELSNAGNMEVVESGEVRQVLLQSRTIMEGGLSLPQADILRAALDVDLVVTGIVTEYQDSTGVGTEPKVEFSTRVFDMKTRQIMWSSSSFNEGDDGVFFFDLGRVNTAHEMASGMVRSVVAKMRSTMKAK